LGHDVVADEFSSAQFGSVHVLVLRTSGKTYVNVDVTPGLKATRTQGHVTKGHCIQGRI